MERRLRLGNTSGGWRLASAGVVRSTIARLILGAPAPKITLGAITLHPHQRSAAKRLLTAIDQFNGALLCDDVGMGKTYVALAVAQDFNRCLVVAPAALTPMWTGAIVSTESKARLVTMEALSRAEVKLLDARAGDRVNYELVIVDEAHHARNPRTNRYFALESLVRGSKVLLLSATPVHNRRHDLVALLSLFLGSRAQTMTSAELALCVVRREQRQLEDFVRIPAVLPVVSHLLSDNPPLVQQLMDLPPPIPLRDGGLAGTLVGRGLVHQWASSEAALNEAIKKRIARAVALCSSLEAGTYPTARELESWIYSEGTLQLGFAELLSQPMGGRGDLLGAVRAHLGALEKIKAQFSSSTAIDAQRARIIAEVKSSRTDTRIVAFAQYSETISTLFRRLVHIGRVAMLTSHGARVAGGSLSRMDAISRFAPGATGCADPGPAEAISLLLTTDLLSEGLNLQDADTVIHLDIPWTVARMEQRVGRVARLGSRHAEVHVHVLRPPASAANILDSESILKRKWLLTSGTVGTAARSPEFDANHSEESSGYSSPESTPRQVERLREILEGWICVADLDVPQPDDGSELTLVAAVDSVEPGFVAAVSAAGTMQLLVGLSGAVVTDLPNQINALRSTGAVEVPTAAADIDRAMASIDKWSTVQNAATAAGLGESRALRRGVITHRIDALIESAPPHLRASRLAVAARARAVAITPQSAAIERDLDALARSLLPPDEWLQAISALENDTGRLKETSTDPLKIHAILLLRGLT